jgi:NADP-reducing hydrogenase subunit HndB
MPTRKDRKTTKTTKKSVEKKAAPPAAAKKLRIQDLAAIRDRTKSLLTVREGEGRAKITVHMGTCGIAAGARGIMEALLDEMKRKKVTDVIVTTSGCAGLCNREPMATVERKDQAPVKYVDLTPEKIRRILVEHAVGGRMVTECALAVGSETVY